MYASLLFLPLLLVWATAQSLDDINLDDIDLDDMQVIQDGTMMESGRRVVKYKIPGKTRVVKVKVPGGGTRVGDRREIHVTSGGKCPRRPMDCEELLTKCKQKNSGIYRVFPQGNNDEFKTNGFQVYCDMETEGGGWTVIQRRGDNGEAGDYFYKDWKAFKEGFGNLNKDFWLGNDKIYALSNQRPTTLRFDLEDWEGKKRYAAYKDFKIDDESASYKLHIGTYKGDAGDSFRVQNLQKFTTKDRDNDLWYGKNCAEFYKGAWWHAACHYSSLNGLYLKGKHTSFADGVNWLGFKGLYYSLKKTEMKLRSTSFVP